MSDDLVSRQIAKDAICNACGKIDCDQMDTCEKLKFPSAQPEKRTEERTETHACDLIDRQAAIDAHYEYCNKHPDAGFPVWSLKILEDLPSAQPEDCDTCKHGYFGDSHCDNCRVRYPSHYERRTE